MPRLHYHPRFALHLTWRSGDVGCLRDHLTRLASSNCAWPRKEEGVRDCLVLSGRNSRQCSATTPRLRANWSAVSEMSRRATEQQKW